ncbi:type II secretion system inner membrane protein GspF [Halothermothrix orenii]|uniref:Tfp pilus biogenesis protein PilC n=1 Tax=Halothermothrix orenii (strain H 168 / OCM 544 / DSM 9562) TaxID=373903 RepID=B8D2C9_HALOH|nr:type II secretion system inner membrane protein GspF [Halothermothrix orenii]ACL69356.1 Tfp pilus biogenesis protein PilC [Halothermothrix orenii H 168]
MAPEFEYEAVSKSGERIKGTITADNSTVVARQLREEGYYITSIEEQVERKEINIQLSNRVKTKDLVLFTQQFSVLLNAGISLVEALDIMYDQVEHPRLKEVVRSIQEDVETGSSLTDALLKHPDVFPELYCQMVKAGEAGGVLDQVLEQLSAHYERQDEINSKVKSAMYYPVILLVVAVGVVIFLMTRVVPQFISLFSSMDVELPLPTRILIKLSTFLSSYWWALFGGLGLTVALLLKYKSTPEGRRRFDSLILKIPVFGKLMRKIYVSRFTNTLSILLTSGIDIISALAIVEEVVGNKVFSDVISRSRTQVSEGISLSRPLDESGEFPRMVIQMINVGEEAGSLDNMLQKVSDFYDKEVETSINNTVSLIEPLMIVVLAVIVGFIVMSIILPMFEMYEQF